MAGVTRLCLVTSSRVYQRVLYLRLTNMNGIANPRQMALIKIPMYCQKAQSLLTFISSPPARNK